MQMRRQLVKRPHLIKACVLMLLSSSNLLPILARWDSLRRSRTTSIVRGIACRASPALASYPFRRQFLLLSSVARKWQPCKIIRQQPRLAIIICGSSKLVETEEIDRALEGWGVWKMYSCWCLTRFLSQWPHPTKMMTKSGDVWHDVSREVSSCRKTEASSLWIVAVEAYRSRTAHHYPPFLPFDPPRSPLPLPLGSIDLLYSYRLRGQTAYLCDLRREWGSHTCLPGVDEKWSLRYKGGELKVECTFISQRANIWISKSSISVKIIE